MMTGIAEQCVNRWRNILPHFGVSTKYLTGRQTPCPKCGGRDRFRFDDKEGRGTYYCNQCGAGDGVQLAMLVTGLPFRDVAQRIRDIAPAARPEKAKPTMDEEKRRHAMNEIWRDSAPVSEDNDAGQYLLSRGIVPPFSDALRFVPKLRVTGESVPVMAAMIALVRDPKGNPLTLHRTYLNGPRKANISSPRRMFPGTTPAGSYVALAPEAEDMGVAEGIETALKVQQRFGLPCWSVISADGLKAFTPPVIVRRLHIFGDNDANFTGHAASYALANRLAVHNDHISVSVKIPAEIGSDWADAA